MLTVDQINTHFVSLIPKLRLIAKGIAFKKNRTSEPDAIINEAYIYVIEKQDIITDTDFLERVIINWIKSMLTWTKTSIHAQEKLNDLIHVPDILDNSQEEIESKLDLELWYTNNLSVLDSYRAQEHNKVKSIIIECYFDKGITKGVDLAKHLKINKDSACKYIREMKADIRNYRQNNPL